MTPKEINHYAIVEKLINKEINGTQAASLLKLSIRHIKKLKARVKKYGLKALVHGNRGKSSSRRIPEQEKDRIIKLIHKHYSNFKPGFASEKLFEKKIQS